MRCRKRGSYIPCWHSQANSVLQKGKKRRNSKFTENRLSLAACTPRPVRYVPSVIELLISKSLGKKALGLQTENIPKKLED